MNYPGDKKIRAIVSESWSVSWPMTLIMFFIFLIGLSDVYVAGKFGKECQAAYGLAFQLFFIFSIIAMAFTIGTVSIIARLFTSDRENDLTSAIISSVVTVGAAGIVMGIVAFLFSTSFIEIFNIPAKLKDYVISLFKIYSSGLIFNFLLVNTNGILRACNMIRKSLLSMLAVCVLNMALNFYLGFCTPLGFIGIAVATLISRLTGCILNMSFLVRLLKGSVRFSFPIVRNIFHIGWPAGLLQVFWQFGIMMIFFILSLLPEHNVETMAALTNGLKIEAFIFLPAFAFNMANAVVVGNRLGKNDKVSAFFGGIVTAVMGLVIVMSLTVIIMLNARNIASFLSDNSIVVRESVKYIYISLLAEPLMAWGVILAGALSGAGDTRTLMIIMGLSVWLVRVPLSYILGVVFAFGAVGIWWAMNISIVVQTIFIARRYFSRKWIAYSEKTIPA